MAPQSPELETAWSLGGEAFRAAMHSRCTQYAIAWEAYDVFSSLALSHRMTLKYDSPTPLAVESAAALVDDLIAWIQRALERLQ
jgi:hypothetical protein